MKGIIVAILHIYGVISAYLLFCDHQETDYDEHEMYISISWPVLTQKMYQSIYGKNVSILYNMGEKVVAILHTSRDRQKFYYFVFTKTLNLGNNKWILG